MLLLVSIFFHLMNSLCIHLMKTKPLSTLTHTQLHHLLKKLSSSLSHLHQIHAHLIFTHSFPSLPPPLFNFFLQSYCKSPNYPYAIHLFRQLQIHLDHCNTSTSILPLPDKYTFTFLISSSSRHFSPHLGQSAHALSLKNGLHSHLNVGNSLINFYSVFADMDSARKMFEGMPLRDVVSWTTLVKGYTNAREMNIARGVFDGMPYRNVVSWVVLISGYVNGEMYTDALDVFNVMLRESKKEIVPNEAVIVSVLTACAHLGALDQGKWIHAYIDKTKMRKTSNIVTTLIHMYSKCGRIESANKLFYSLPTRDLMTWTSMISGLALHGLGNDALRLFDEMLAQGIRPDNITLLSVLNACSHSGLVDEGCSVFYNMNRLWRLLPKIEHYGCLIDLLGRAGQLEKAVAIVIKMPMEPDIAIWRALLSACRTHGNIKLGKHIIDHIARLDLGSSQGGGHVLLSNMYASLGQWDEVARVRNQMREKAKGLSSPGCSWIEIDGVVHEFLAADKLHPQICEIKKNLEQVLREVSLKGGYTVNTRNVLFDLSGEDREHAVYWHSEKLAVAFGMMRLEAGCCIRIVKNLRICEDCHSAMRAISRVFCREIVVRDRSRFHTFREGHCSCNDYW